jgi:hypothetical protein
LVRRIAETRFGRNPQFVFRFFIAWGSTLSAFPDIIPSMSNALQYLVDERGEKTAVVLPISDYEKLVEDLEDLAVVAERRGEPTIQHEQFVADLKRDGIL